MPADFDKCVKEGGDVKTISGPSKNPKLKAGEYIHVCVSPDGGRYWGEKKKKKMTKKSNNVKIRITRTIKTITLSDINSESLIELQNDDLVKVHAILHKLWKDPEVSKKDLLSSHVLLLSEFAGRNIEHTTADTLDTLEDRLKKIELDEV